LYEFRGQSDTELSFGAGEIVHLISHLDDDWCFGELDGKHGAFPTSYVDIIVDCDNSGNDQVIKSPTEPVEAIPMVTQPLPSNQQPSYATNTTCNVTGNTTDLYGRLISDFIAINVNEVDASEGETVTVLQRINKDWLEVRHDNGKVGLCPASFVELFGAEPEPAAKPDVHTPSVVKPKLPAKPKLLTATRSGSLSPANVDQKSSPVLANPPALSSAQPVKTVPNSSTSTEITAAVSSSPTADTFKSSTTSTVTNSFAVSWRPQSPGLSLDELIQAQLASSRISSSTNGTDSKSSNQKTSSNLPVGAALNGIADVAGQSTWYTFTATEPVDVTPRKPPPPRRPAPARPTQTPAMRSALHPADGKTECESIDGLAIQSQRGSKLIHFGPDHDPSKYAVETCVCYIYLQYFFDSINVDLTLFCVLSVDLLAILFHHFSVILCRKTRCRLLKRFASAWPKLIIACDISGHGEWLHHCS